MRLLSIETGYRDTEGLSYLTDDTDVHGLNSVKIPAYRQAGVTSVRNFLLNSEQKLERSPEVSGQEKPNQGADADNHKPKTKNHKLAIFAAMIHLR